ncbi:MAG: phenylalanine--tRNA ligase subunit beta [Candidatus Uhrbacteria bacterium]|nr:phenylalanine--tRNA ligase subunit beta [Candidatus Uhrbacteria bacterium]
MNILASYNWIKEYLKTDATPADFARELSLKSMSVESATQLADSFKKMVVGVVKEIKAHPNADRLKIALTDIGSDTVETVCGGTNLKEGMRVFVALPGAKVRWHGEGDLVELAETEIRGAKSFGMICAPSEVGFEKAPCVPGGIWDLTNITDAKAGTSIEDALNIDDTIFDIEITTNRPDAMSIIGLAREGAAVTGGEFNFETIDLPQEAESPVFPLRVTVKDEDLCPRYMAVVMDGIKVGPSPAWLQMKILLAGHRPINNIVDITNLILHEYGQPLHAFDYEKLEGEEIIVRRAKNGEKFLALDEKEYELNSDNLVIADKKRPVALGGVMGGQDSGTWDGTTTVVFEAATFDPVSVRRTARGLNLFSDSQLLFEKGLSTESPAIALARAIQLTREIAGGKVASAVIDERAQEYKPKSFRFRPHKVRELMGVNLEENEMFEILERLGFTVEATGEVSDPSDYSVIVPFWRGNDIESEVDFAEEIARIYGYHNLPSVLPQGAPPSTIGDQDLVWEKWAKDLLATSGYTELFGYSFVSQDDLSRYGLDPDKAIRLHNPLTSDLTHMRTSLMPSLLKDIKMNQGELTQGSVFELARIYLPREKDLPEERTQLTIAEFGLIEVEPAFLRVKGMIEEMAKKSGLRLSFDRSVDSSSFQGEVGRGSGKGAHWHPNRSARIILNDESVGVIGQLSSEYQDAFGIDRPLVVAQIDFQKIQPWMHVARRYVPIADYPAITRDLAIVVDEKAEFESLAGTIKEQSSIVESVDLFDIYRGTGIPEGKKSVALSITLRAPDRTLSHEHADDVISAVEKALKEKFSAVIR